MYRLLYFVTACLLAAPAFAQESPRIVGAPLPGASAAFDGPAARGLEPEMIHATDLLRRSAQGRRALELLEQERAAGKTAWSASKTALNEEIGDTLAFKVINFLHYYENDSLVLDPISFTLTNVHDRFRLWVETAELDNGHVRPQDLDSLYDALALKTPSGSIDPGRGIIVNNEELFGDPPDVNGDGKTDVLLLDIRDTYETQGTYTGGFVWSGDLITNPSYENGNHRDILYLDTNPSLFRNGDHRDTHDLEGTAAHEYQHLIQYNYDTNPGGEETFVNEGLSEWAEVANGYVNRAIRFVAVPEEHAHALFNWRSGESAVIYDYERAGLFTTYLAQRLGADSTGALVRAKDPDNFLKNALGARAYRVVLGRNGLTLENVLADFYTANFLNNSAVDPDYGYALPEHQNAFRAVPTQSFDGSEGTSTALTVPIRAGSGQYISWTDVVDVEVRVDVTGLDAPLSPEDRTLQRSVLRARAILEHADGRVTVQDVELGSSTQRIEGDFERATLLLAHGAPSGSIKRSTGQPYNVSEIRLSVNAAWTAGVAEETIEEIAYDDGSAKQAGFFAMKPSATAVQATRFVPPSDDARLASVSISPYFYSQFSNGEQPREAPRDFTLRVWAAAPGGGPGTELFSLEREDVRPYSGASTELDFFTIDLSGHAEELSNLPDTIFVGFSNAGTDANELVLAVSSYAAENLSYVGDLAAGTWTRLWDHRSETANTISPIRASFAVPNEPVAVVESADLPEQVALEPNYPNPFNPSTAIRYSLPRAQAVRLAVYDVQGRLVATLADGLQPAGVHEVRVDASRWASGLYLYRLETDARTLSRTMLLVK